MNISVSIEYPIDELLDKFDFKKVHALMVRLDWKWQGHIPTIEELRTRAKELLLSLDPTRDDSVMTGGFLASVRRGKDISLSFVLTDAREPIPTPVILESKQDDSAPKRKVLRV